MSDANETRIGELQDIISALCARVVQLEELMMNQNQRSAARRASKRPLRPDAPSYQPPSAPSRAPTEKPATTEKPALTETLAPTEKPATTEKPALTETPAPPEKPANIEKSAPTKEPAPTKASAAPTTKPAPTQPVRVCPHPHSILYNANIPQSKPNQPENEHLKFIQTLHRDGHSKDDITERALATYPDLCKGQGAGTEEARKVIVLSNVEIYTSKWADSYI
ncbi:hypothetical protein MMC22_001693 [Lobaria immixta]|nr:hypothetical protein [Lobaria immixta]